MKVRALIGIMLIGVFAIHASAQTAPLRVIVSNGMKAVVEQLRPQLESEAGRPLMTEFATSAAVRQRIEAGEAFDIAILTTEVVKLQNQVSVFCFSHIYCQSFRYSFRY